jgi:hypothetical protein
VISDGTLMDEFRRPSSSVQETGAAPPISTRMRVAICLFASVAVIPTLGQSRSVWPT